MLRIRSSGKVYGLQRVCRVLGVARSTVYARRMAALMVWGTSRLCDRQVSATAEYDR